MEEKAKPLILILCTGNSCRSHIAEGILQEVAGDVLNVQSAGSDPAGFVHPLAVTVLAGARAPPAGNGPRGRSRPAGLTQKESVYTQ